MANSTEKVAVKETGDKKGRQHAKPVDRIKGNLTNDVLRGKIPLDDLVMLEEHLKKLKAVIS